MAYKFAGLEGDEPDVRNANGKPAAAESIAATAEPRAIRPGEITRQRPR